MIKSSCWEDIPGEKLRRGSVGHVIEQWEDDVFEVEFSDKNTGVTYAMLALKGDQLLKLFWKPIEDSE